MAELDGPEIAQRRPPNLGIAGRPHANVTEVIGWLGAIQSQEYAAAKWSVGCAPPL